MSEKVRSFIRLTRINEYYGSIMLITAVGLLISDTGNYSKIFLAFLANLLGVAFAFMFNDTEDYIDDRSDPKSAVRNPVSANMISPQEAYVASFLVAGLSLMLYAMLGVLPFLFGLLAQFLGFVYSWRVTRLKSVPILDFVSHGMFLGLLQFIAAVCINPSYHLQPHAFYLGALTFLVSCLGDLNNEIRDYEADRSASLNNTLSLFDLRRFQPLVQYSCLLPLAILLLYASDHLTFVGRVLICALLAIALIGYFISPVKGKRDDFFYTRSQQLGFTLAVVIAIAR